MNEMERILMETMHERASEMPAALELDSAAVDKASRRHGLKMAGIGTMSVAAVVAVAVIGYGVFTGGETKSSRVGTGPTPSVASTTTAATTTVPTPTTSAPAPAPVKVAAPSKMVAVVDGKLALVDSNTGKVVKQYDVALESAFTFRVAPDGKAAYATLSDSCDGGVSLQSVNLADGSATRLVEDAAVEAVSPDGNLLAIRLLGCGPAHQILDLRTGERWDINGAADADGNQLAALSMAFIDNERLAVSTFRYPNNEAVTDADVRILDVRSGRTLDSASEAFTKNLPVQIHDAATIDGREALVVTTGDNPNKVRLLDAKTGEEIRVLAELPEAGKLAQADLDPSGFYLVTSNFKGEVRRWENGQSTVVPGVSAAAWVANS